MLSIIFSTLLLSTFSRLANAFDPNSNENVVLYWGQNSASTQQRLSYYCENDVADILVLSFMSSFPGTDGKPTLNFANACWDTQNGVLHCTTIADDIKTCQESGKIVLLSMGGAVGSYGFSSENEAEDFAGTVWDMFGEGDGNTRPFDDAILDGFDLDLENKKPDYYSNFVTKLREYYATGTKEYYISAAPQCVLPDASVNEAMINSDIDFAFIQFYNNYCELGSEFNYNDWVNWAKTDSYNKDIKLYVGLPGSSAAAGSGYASPDVVKTYIDDVSCESHFGGISIWDASQAYANTQNGKNFAESAKDILIGTNTCSGNSETSITSKIITSVTSSAQTTSSETLSSATSSSPVTASSYSSLTTSSTKTTITLQPSDPITNTIISTVSISIATEIVKEVTTSASSFTKYTTTVKTEDGSIAYITITRTPADNESSNLTNNPSATTDTTTYADDSTSTGEVISSSTVTYQEGETYTFTFTNEYTTTTYTTIYQDASSSIITSTDSPTTTDETSSATTTSTSKSDPATSSSTSDDNNNNETCIEGEWQCGDDGTIQHCNFGKWVSFQCASNTVCKKYNFDGTDIVGCVWP